VVRVRNLFILSPKKIVAQSLSNFASVLPRLWVACTGKKKMNHPEIESGANADDIG
jgi:hypothetical protein